MHGGAAGAASSLLACMQAERNNCFLTGNGGRRRAPGRRAGEPRGAPGTRSRPGRAPGTRSGPGGGGAEWQRKGGLLAWSLARSAHIEAAPATRAVHTACREAARRLRRPAAARRHGKLLVAGGRSGSPPDALNAALVCQQVDPPATSNQRLSSDELKERVRLITAWAARQNAQPTHLQQHPPVPMARLPSAQQWQQAQPRQAALHTTLHSSQASVRQPAGLPRHYLPGFPVPVPPPAYQQPPAWFAEAPRALPTQRLPSSMVSG